MLAALVEAFLKDRKNYYINPVSYVVALGLRKKLVIYAGKLRLSYAEGLVLHGLLATSIANAERYPDTTFCMFLRSIFLRIDDLLTL